MSRNRIFTLMQEIGEFPYNEDDDDFPNMSMAMFFYHVGINTLRSYQTEITLGNMSAKEKKITGKFLPQFARKLMNINRMFIISERESLHGIFLFRVNVLPELKQLVYEEIIWKDFAICLLWWEERCRLLLETHPTLELRPTNDYEGYAIRTEWWSGPVRLNLASYQHNANEYLLTD